MALAIAAFTLGDEATAFRHRYLTTARADRTHEHFDEG